MRQLFFILFLIISFSLSGQDSLIIYQTYKDYENKKGELHVGDLSSPSSGYSFGSYYFIIILKRGFLYD